MVETDTPQQPGQPGGLRVTRTVDAKEIPPKDQWANQAQRDAADSVADAMRGRQANGSPSVVVPEDSMVIQIPDGRMVELGPPPVAIGFMIARIMADAGATDLASV